MFLGLVFTALAFGIAGLIQTKVDGSTLGPNENDPDCNVNQTHAEADMD